MSDLGPERLAAHAAATPDKAAVIMAATGETRTYAELELRSRQLACMLRERGLQDGDHLAVLIDNDPAFFDIAWAGMRTGLYVTAINWHLTAAEAGYILRDCGAKVLLAGASLRSVVEQLGDDLAGVTTRLSAGGDLPGFEPYEPLLDGPDPGPIPGEREGIWMFYSSGTTGRPKGILPPLPVGPFGAPGMVTRLQTGLYGMDADSVYLSPAPLHHAAPAGWTVGTHRIGGTAVVMERFDPLAFLEAVERYRITHTQVVPTHMIRLLKLPAADRERFDLSSLQTMVHAAAPCPVETKQSMLEWLGPIVYEFYSGSEGAGFCCIGPEEWLAHPGSVGKSLLGGIHIVGDDGEELPVGEEGEVWFETQRRFEYHGDPEKTAAAFDDRGWGWLGDVGRVDAEGYLYLTDRASNMIISGGVNIYPRELEDILVVHPEIIDVAVLGTPDPEMGEQVTAFVQLADGATVTAEELIAYSRDRLSHFKCPREVRFVTELPRLPTGKLLKRRLLA